MKSFLKLACGAAATTAAFAETKWPEPVPEETRQKLVADALAKVEKVNAEGPFSPTAESLRHIGIPEWYADAKLGIFIHWGVYSVPAFTSEWYPRHMYKPDRPEYNHHEEKWGPVSEFGYKDFIPMFTAEKFDAEAWAELFEASGAKYIMPVAEHHDGYSLYDNSFTRWDSTEIGPMRDIVGELRDSIRKRGLKFCVSSHRAFNYAFFFRTEGADNTKPEFFDLYGEPQEWLFPNPSKDVFTTAEQAHRHTWKSPKAWRDDWLARTVELADKYEPDVIWFDFGIGRDKYGTPETNDHYKLNQEFAAYYYNQAAKRGQQVTINYKWSAYKDGEAMLDIERGKLNGIRDQVWQTDTSVSFNSWGYITNHDYKPVNVIVDDLVDIVSKNGVLLLNIGPKPDGTIPEHEEMQLRAIGKWLGTNGVGIYGSRPWKIYGEGPTENSEEAHSEHKLGNYTADDIRFTTNNGKLYVWLMDWPEDGKADVRALASGSEHAPEEIASIKMVGGGDVAFSRDEKALHLELPAEKSGEHVFGFEVTFK